MRHECWSIHNVTFKEPRMSARDLLYNKGSIVKMKAKRDLHLATLLFGVIKYSFPPYLAEKMVWSREVKKSFTRSRAWFMGLPRHRSNA